MCHQDIIPECLRDSEKNPHELAGKVALYFFSIEKPHSAKMYVIPGFRRCEKNTVDNLKSF